MFACHSGILNRAILSFQSNQSVNQSTSAGVTWGDGWPFPNPTHRTTPHGSHRHIYRHIESSSPPPSSAFPLTKAETDAWALTFARELEGRGWLGGGAGGGVGVNGEEGGAAGGGGAAAAGGEGEGGKGGDDSYRDAFPLSAPAFVFALMPWRHTPTVEG